MKHLQVFRIEHPSDGNGLWRAELDEGGYIIDEHSQYFNIELRHQSDNYPNFQDDEVLNSQLDEDDLRLNYKFAFNTLEQLKQALTSEEIKESIRDLGFKIYLIKTDMYYQSSFQTVFHTNHIISKEDISSLFL